MQAKDIMTTPVVTISPEATVREAANLMLEHQVSCLPVLDRDEGLVGILTHTDFDLHRKFIALADDLYSILGTSATSGTLEDAAKEASGKPVRDVMRRNVATIGEEASITEMAELMLRLKVHRLPVMRGQNLVGIITRHDLLKLFASDPPAHHG